VGTLLLACAFVFGNEPQNLLLFSGALADNVGGVKSMDKDRRIQGRDEEAEVVRSHGKLEDGGIEVSRRQL